MYKIPEEKEIINAILKVLDKHKEINSQGTFLKLVLKELKKRDKEYVVSSDRAKRIAAGLKEVGVHVDKKRSRREAKKCFVCGGELGHIMARDLQGNETKIGKRCKVCGFELDKDKLSPQRYIFYRH
ncbi:MAG: hypothetical protein ACE5J5_03160 [Candidatus Hydrothermarchaeales archaeon]